MALRSYQETLKNDIYDAWRSGQRNVLAVSPTGSGKTTVISSIFEDMNRDCGMAIAHRQELVAQISCTLARDGIYHNILAPDAVIRFIIHLHIERFGKNFYHRSTPTTVAGIQTILARKDQNVQLLQRQSVWQLDEAHHAAADTIWWKGVHLMPRAVGVGWTGTPRRTDKKPLGRTFGGLFDQMVIGPTYRYLIDEGYLCKYRIFAPPSSVDLSHVEISKRTGDFNETEKNKATEKSQVVGDIVEQYLKIAPGKIGITFVPTVKLAQETAQRFVQRGVPAECVHGGSDSAFRVRSIAQHARGELKQLVNVGLFGEGFDVPVCEVVSDGDGTMSLTDFMQRFGRMLRPADGKEYGIYIDHVENVIRHGLPDAPRSWSLDVDYRGSKRGRDESVMPVRTCMQCDGAYEAITRICPYCGYVDTPSASARNDPAQVDGDLFEMSPELLARLRGDISKNEGLLNREVGSAKDVVMKRNLETRYETLQELRQVINYWAGIQVYGMGRSESEAYSRYFHRFGVDVLTAQTLTTPEMRSLIEKIRVDTI